ncbi:hypothetical protein ACOME3_000336 [Neoechinorhynchus agilis]
MRSKDGTFDGALIDCGLSSDQLDDSQRGFSFINDGPLDMRMSLSDDLRADHLINFLDQEKLLILIQKYAEEKRFAKQMVEAIIAARPIKSTVDLARTVENVCPRYKSNRDSLGRRTHPATRVFMALRCVVNDELNELCKGIRIARRYLKLGRPLVVISYNSHEDRIVKQAFANGDEWVVERKLHKLLLPEKHEVEKNKRARSAKLRFGLKYESKVNATRRVK